MAIVFALRGTSLDAYRSFSGKSPGLFYNDSNGAPAVASDGGAFGGSAINLNLASGTANRGLIYTGLNNLSNNAAFAILIRYAPNYTGSPAQNRSLWQVTSGLTSTGFGTMRMYHTTAGKLHLWISRCSDGLDCTDAATTASFSPTSGTYYDIMFSWDGTGSANTMKFSVNGAELETRSPASSRARSGQDVKFTPGLIIGGNYNQAGLNGKLSEFIVWDNAEPHTYTARTDFLSTTAFDGLSNTDPGIANVRLSTGYVIAGTSYTGTAAIPSAANVRSGTAVGSTTGSLVVPAAADVRIGTSVDASTGLLNLPSESNVRSGVSYDNGTKTGSFVAIENQAADVKHGVTASDGVGTYRGYDIWQSVDAGDLASGVSVLQDGQEVDGTAQLIQPPSVRNSMSLILIAVGSSALTDEEWDGLAFTGEALTVEGYDALVSILESRENVSNSLQRLEYYYLSRGIDISGAADTESTDSVLFLGSDLSDASVISDEKSNVYIGGDLGD